MSFTTVLENQKLHRAKIEKTAKKAALIALIGSSLMFMFQLIFSLAILNPLIRYFPNLYEGTLSFLVDIVGYVFYIAVPFGIVALMFKKLNKNIENNGVKRAAPKAAALYIFGVVGIGYIVNLSINLIFGSLIEKYSVDMGIAAEGVLQIILCYIMYAVLPAVLEEWAFRGILCKNLLPYGKGGAIIISSVLFGIAHVDPPRVVFATAFGLMLAVCYEYTRSLKIPMLIHFINNAISVTMSLVDEESIIALVVSQLILGLIGCGIAAIIFYANKGITRKKISIIKPASVGYKLNIGNFVAKATLNFGMIPLVILYAIFFAIYYVI